jgi:hypothetical protein
LRTVFPGQERLVQNQQDFRHANERLKRCLDGTVADDLPIPFICECADEGCLEPVRVTLRQYHEVRYDDTRFLIVSGHRTVTGEAVVEERGSYTVVAKSSPLKRAVKPG